MFSKAVFSIVLSLALAAAAAGQIDPKGFLADKALDFSKARALPFQAPNTTLFENVIVGTQHFAMVAGWKRNKLEPIELHPLISLQVPRRTINTLADWEVTCIASPVTTRRRP